MELFDLITGIDRDSVQLALLALTLTTAGIGVLAFAVTLIFNRFRRIK